MSDYQTFLASKAPRPRATGIEPGPMHPAMRPDQCDVTAFALRQGCAALFLDTGLGKTFDELEWCRQAAAASNGYALLLTPLAVARQIEREAARWGYEARVIRSQDDARPGINICNYDRLDLLDPARFGAVALDECFAKGTEIDTPHGKKHIETIRPGDYILNCTGADLVSDVHQREVPYAVMVKVAGTSFIASPNHPIFTQRGWVGAQHLRPNDYALATGAAMRLVRDGVLPEISGTVQAEILRTIMLSEMAHDAERCVGACARAGSGDAEGCGPASMARIRPAGRFGRVGTDNTAQPNMPPGSSGKDFGRIESHESRTIRAWGKWSRNDIAASINDGCSWARLGSGISVITGPKEARIPNLLQAGLRASADESRSRGGWSVPQRAEDCGRPKAGCSDPFVRLDGIEILEPGDNRLDELRDADGKLYFYDLGATRHPSYSVSGFLVHNSSILKSFMGATTRALISAFEGHRFKLCATATPAPNDHMELGNHAEFLGQMGRMEMLSRWFINDTAEASQSWRLKGHAEASFWEWMATWSRCAETPADLGYDASGFVLPSMRIVRHRVAGDVRAPAGLLFAQDVSATNLHDIKRQTADARADRVAALVATEPHESWVIWCDTDYEADALARRIPCANEVRGTHPVEKKEAALEAFSDGSLRAIITKPKICGYGLNWQHSARMAFVGRSFSYEAWYQAVRRCWRYGQTRPVDVHIMVAEGEDQIGRVIDRKSEGHERMKRAMARSMRAVSMADKETKIPYNPTYLGSLPAWLKSAA